MYIIFGRVDRQVLVETSDLSDVDSVASFTVDEPPLEEPELGLTPAKLDWVTAIFGDVGVLQPLGVPEAEEEADLGMRPVYHTAYIYVYNS